MAKARPILGVNPEDTLVANAVLILAARVSELLAWERFVYDPNRVNELHEMRIAAKRLRYTLEIMGPLFDGALDDSIERVKRMQDHLGNIHDADILVPELEAHLRDILTKGRRRRIVSTVDGRHLDAAAGLLRLCRRKRDERVERYDKFVALWKQLRDEAFFERLKAISQRAAADESERMLEQRARAVSMRQQEDRSVDPNGEGE